jgi:hypothetical protein
LCQRYYEIIRYPNVSTGIGFVYITIGTGNSWDIYLQFVTPKRVANVTIFDSAIVVHSGTLSNTITTTVNGFRRGYVTSSASTWWGIGNGGIIYADAEL